MSRSATGRRPCTVSSRAGSWTSSRWTRRACSRSRRASTSPATRRCGRSSRPSRRRSWCASPATWASRPPACDGCSSRRKARARRCSTGARPRSPGASKSSWRSGSSDRPLAGGRRGPPSSPSLSPRGARMVRGPCRETPGRVPRVSVLVVAEHLRGELRPVTLELVTAAKELEGPVAVAVIANDPSRLSEAVNVDGVDEIVTVTVDAAEFENDVYQEVVEALIRERTPKVTLLGFTVNSMGFGPAIAAKLGLGFASDVFALRNDSGSLLAERAFYGSKAHAELEFPGKEQVLLLVRPTTWPAAEGQGSATVTDFPVTIQGSRARHKNFEEVAAGDVDITTADFLLSVGRGIGDKENLPRFEELADKMGATLSVSRPIVDAGWMANARQVGQSGKTVKPKVYLALGISGAVQHLAGMKTSGTIIAVNSDPEAPIFRVAHYGAVADLFDVADELDKLY